MNNRYLVLIEGKRADIFLSILISRGIAIYHKENTKKGITMVVDEEGYKLICLPEETSVFVNNGNISVVGKKPIEIINDTTKNTIETEREISL